MQTKIREAEILFLQENWIYLRGKKYVSGNIPVPVFLFLMSTNI